MASYVGIDIGSDAIKLVELKKTRRGLVLKKAGYLPYSEIPVFDEMSRSDRQAEALRWALAQNNIKKAKAMVALPAEDVYSKYIKLPPVTPDKVHQIVQFEARQQIPFPLEDVSWGYHLIGADRGTSQAHVVLHAIKDRAVYEFMQNIDSQNIFIQSLDVSAMALYNLASFNQVPVGSVLVDIGCEQTHFLVIDDHGFWSRTLPMGGNRFKQHLVEKLSLEPGEAQLFMQTVGLQGEGADFQKSQALEEALEELIGEIKKTQQHYLTLSPTFMMQRLYLTGGHTRIQGALDVFVKRFEADIELMDPFRNVSVAPSVGYDQAQNMRHFFATAMGLALRQVWHCPVQINLLPDGLQKERQYSRLSYGMLSWALALAVFGGIYWHQSQESVQFFRKQAALAERESNAFRGMEQTISDLSNQILPLEAQLKYFAEISQKRSLLLDRMLDLKKVTINDMYYPMIQYGLGLNDMHVLDELKYDPKQRRLRSQEEQQEREKLYLIQPHEFYFKGVTSDSYKKVDGLKIGLESYPYVSRVDVDYAEEGRQDERTKIAFTLKAAMKDL